MYVYKLWCKILKVRKPLDDSVLLIDADTGKEAKLEFSINQVSKGFLKSDSSGNLSLTENITVDKGIKTLSGTVNATGWQTIFTIANLESWLISATEDGGGNHGVYSAMYTNMGGGTIGNIQSIGITCQVSGTNVQLNCGSQPYTWAALRLK